MGQWYQTQGSDVRDEPRDECVVEHGGWNRRGRGHAGALGRRHKPLRRAPGADGAFGRAGWGPEADAGRPRRVSSFGASGSSRREHAPRPRGRRRGTGARPRGAGQELVVRFANRGPGADVDVAPVTTAEFVAGSRTGAPGGPERARPPLAAASDRTRTFTPPANGAASPVRASVANHRLGHHGAGRFRGAAPCIVSHVSFNVLHTSSEASGNLATAAAARRPRDSQTRRGQRFTLARLGAARRRGRVLGDDPVAERSGDSAGETWAGEGCHQPPKVTRSTSSSPPVFSRSSRRADDRW